MLKLKFLVLVLYFLLFTFFSFSRNLDGLNIISRKQWQADENWLLKDFYIHKNYKPQVNKKKLWLRKQRKNYLMKYFPLERQLDAVKYYYLGKKLYWAFSYKFNKTKIIIHHTDTLAKKIKTKQDAIKAIQGIYKYHTLKRHWGDIGYHFIIDPLGNIYEGKAGGEGIVGAHSKWNNPESIGIALIGNFEIEKPTKKQLQSLIKLTVALSKKYSINPYKYVIYHKEYKKYPYILNVKNYSIVGHKDTGYTSCPGKKLYKLLPWIRKRVYEGIQAKSDKVRGKNKNNLSSDNLLINQKQSSVKLVKSLKSVKFINFGKKLVFDDKLLLSINDNLSFCGGLKLKGLELNCKGDQITLIRKGYFPFKKLNFTAYGEKFNYKISIFPIFVENFRYLAKQKSVKYLGNKINKNKIKKIKHKVYLSKDLFKKPVKVLLYELSFLNYWDIACSKSCTLLLDNKKLYAVKKFKVDRLSKLLVWVNDKSYSTNSLTILGNGGEIIFQNYKRKSYAGIPWNFFKGNIAIKKDYIKEIGKKISKKYIVINMLSLNDYLNGIAEANDQVPYEKAKVMALLSKSYILFYLDKGNIHPSIPKKARYNAIDDPRIFQKYVGAGYERTAKNWKKVLKDTKNEYLLYKGYVPILPYFSCSVGFTFSAKQKFGRIDTPYLVNNLDLGKCKTFKGHGVGLSGKGAESLAKKGFNYRQIINWYFPGVEIKKLNY